MGFIKVNKVDTNDPESVISLCPFKAIEYDNGLFAINAACKMCRLCVKERPDVFELIEQENVSINKDEWRGIAVYVEHQEGDIHPVTYELIGKAREMAAKISHPVYAVFIGHQVTESATKLLAYGVDEVFVYDSVELKHFRIEPYTAAMEDFIHGNKPSIILVGGTTVGRSLAPRAAARFRTGLTADCTVLDVQENTDLDQIRPAFGGNIMAHIHTPNHRPQFATVRYKIFDKPEPADKPQGKVTNCKLNPENLVSNINVLDVRKKDQVKGIEDAEVIIVAGRGIKKESDLDIVYKLADCLGAEVASTRPLIEAGWTDPRKQIGLSGRTVKPKLLITCGVSGAIQFVAGMQNSATIIAINSDKDAPIFKVAHYGIVGDIYDIIPQLCNKIDQKQETEEVTNV
jgi:electron transfer flavoprotein alpha subunit